MNRVSSHVRSAPLWVRVLQYIWASPNTMIGIFIGLLGLSTGGKSQIQNGCIEFYGGLVTWMLSRTRSPGGVIAMTLGHAIIGQTKSGLELVRDHEHVHVRQYERWGPFFIPAYLICSGYLWLQNKECYRGNPFEIEAYQISDPSHRSDNSTTDQERPT